MIDCGTCIKNHRERLLTEALSYVDDVYIDAYFDMADTHDDIICRCNKRIEPPGPYIEENRFIDTSIELLSKYISNKIECCSHCDGTIIDQLIEDHHSGESDYEMSDDDVEYFLSLGTKINDLIEFPLDFKSDQKLISMLHCKNCGYGFKEHEPFNSFDQKFQLDEKVYTLNEIDKVYEQLRYTKIKDFAKEYGIKINENKMIKFVTYLKKHPLLGLNHPVGKNIYKLLKEHYTRQHFSILEQGTFLYRGRTIPKKSENYAIEQLWQPPQSIASHGRFNSVGSSVLYCCNKRDYIALEVHPHHKQDICLAVLSVKRRMIMLDIDKLFYKFNGFLKENSEYDGIYNLDYVLTNYIADCCKAIGYNGVVYSGVKDSGYINYAFFNYEKHIDLEIAWIERLVIKIQYQTSIVRS